jgi:ABC-type nitrate/sulfonate/bicarbonate transport system ATPase subunit
MMVFQEIDQLPSWMAVRDNIQIPLLASGKLPREGCVARIGADLHSRARHASEPVRST